MSRDPKDLVGQVERFLLETNAVTCLLGDAPGLCLGRLAHGGHPTNALVLTRTWVRAWVFPDQEGRSCRDTTYARSTKHALPQTFAEVDADEQVVRTTLSKDLIYNSPKIDGELDRTTVAEHYGLAEGFMDPPTRGLGDLEPGDPAYAADEPLRERVAVRKALAGDEGPLDEPPSSPGVTGGDRRRDYPKD